MFIKIDGLMSYQFRKPSLWVLYAIRPGTKLFWDVLFKISIVTAVMLFLYGFANVVVVRREGRSSDEISGALYVFFEMLTATLVVFIVGCTFLLIRDLVIATRNQVIARRKRDYFVTKDNYSYKLLFAGVNYAELSEHERKLIAEFLSDPKIIEADKRTFLLLSIESVYESELIIAKALKEFKGLSWTTQQEEMRAMTEAEYRLLLDAAEASNEKDRERIIQRRSAI